MLRCEGFKMFYGTMQISYLDGEIETICSTWSYKPPYAIGNAEYGYWYAVGRSFPEEICKVIDDCTVWG